MPGRRLKGCSIAVPLFLLLCGIFAPGGAEENPPAVFPACVNVGGPHACGDVHSPGRDMLFDQSATGLFAFCSSQWDSVYPYYSKIADNFSLTSDADIDSVVWWGGYWSAQQNSLVDFRVEFFPESTGLNQPRQDPVYSERVSFAEIDLGGYYRYEARILPFSAVGGERYWITFMATIVFPPHWGNNCSWPSNTPGWGDSLECFFQSDMFGFPQWTAATTALGEPYESSFQLYESPPGCGEEENRANGGVSLFQNVPNPVVGDRTTISYAIRDRAHTRLAIYDVSGSEVAVLVNGIEEAGMKHVLWDGGGANGRRVAAGIYFYRLDAGNASLARKMVVMR